MGAFSALTQTLLLGLKFGIPPAVTPPGYLSVMSGNESLFSATYSRSMCIEKCIRGYLFEAFIITNRALIGSFEYQLFYQIGLLQYILHVVPTFIAKDLNIASHL